MVLTRGRRRSGAVGALLWLLVVAVGLVLALGCPPVAGASGEIAAGRALVSGITAPHTIDVESDCHLLALSGLEAAAAATVHPTGTPMTPMALLLGALVGRARAQHGTTHVRRVWFLRGGRDRLQHLCVMRC